MKISPAINNEKSLKSFIVRVHELESLCNTPDDPSLVWVISQRNGWEAKRVGYEEPWDGIRCETFHDLVETCIDMEEKEKGFDAEAVIRNAIASLE